ncbi:MAG: hypothetical protein R2748_08095 [Bryobacterales bacterium]
MLESAVKEYPKYAAAWNMLGDMRMQLGLQDQALAAYENAVSADPQFILPLLLGCYDWSQPRATWSAPPPSAKKRLSSIPTWTTCAYMCAAHQAGQRERGRDCQPNDRAGPPRFG